MVLRKAFKIFFVLNHKAQNCQAQGPTPGPTQGQGQGQCHGQDGLVRSNSDSNSRVGPELYTKIGFHPPTHSPPPTHHTISK